MWADTLLQAEREHLLRLLVWAGLSIVAATLVATILAARRSRSPLLTHFALQTGAWGVVIGAFAGMRWRSAALRDVTGATRLEHLVWMNMGLDAGYLAVGVAIALTAWWVGRRLAPVGAGIAIAVQGLALLVIEMQFAVVISR